jgi:hypothetical protein
MDDVIAAHKERLLDKKRKLNSFFTIAPLQLSGESLVEAAIAMERMRFGCIGASILSVKDDVISTAHFFQNHLLLFTLRKTMTENPSEPCHHSMMGADLLLGTPPSEKYQGRKFWCSREYKSVKIPHVSGIIK